MQAVILGNANSGKSSLLQTLTKAEPIISQIKMSTTLPTIGMMPFQGTQIQLVENPAIDSEYYNRGLTHTADTLILLINSLEEINQIEEKIKNQHQERIIIFNNKQTLNQNQERKIRATLKSRYKKYPFEILSLSSVENIGETQTIKQLKEKIFNSFGKIRVFTKEPGKEKSPKPIILEQDSTINKD